ncbi:hypothetical protein PMIN03_007980 [Paraphaeosphaeria minitans]
MQTAAQTPLAGEASIARHHNAVGQCKHNIEVENPPLALPSPIQSSPFHSNTVQSNNPAQSNSVQCNAMQSNAMQNASKKATSNVQSFMFLVDLTHARPAQPRTRRSVRR